MWNTKLKTMATLIKTTTVGSRKKPMIKAGNALAERFKKKEPFVKGGYEYILKGQFPSNGDWLVQTAGKKPERMSENDILDAIAQYETIVAIASKTKRLGPHRSYSSPTPFTKR